MTYTPEDFGPFTLSADAHDSPADGMCVMEMVSFLAGEEWSDMPACSSPVVSRFCQVINDRMGQDFRDRLQTYVPRLIGTASPEHDQERAEYLAWQAITVFAPIALRAAGLDDDANALANFDKAKGLDAAYTAADAANAAAYAANAAYAAYAAADAARAANAAARAAANAAYAANAAARAADAAIFETLEGLLAIGPSGTSYTQDQLQRVEPLRRAVEATA